MLCLPITAYVALALASPGPSASAEPEAARPGAEGPTLPPEGTTPLAEVEPAAPAPGLGWLPHAGVTPLSNPAPRRTTSFPSTSSPLARPDPNRKATPATAWMPVVGLSPLNRPVDAGASAPAPIAPFGAGPTLAMVPVDPRQVRVIRLDLVLGPVWRIRPAEAQFLASLEVGRLQGLSGAFVLGLIVAPDRDTVRVVDVPIGGGVVARRRLGARSLWGSVGATAGIIVQRADTEFGVVHRVDPDVQVPLRFMWTAGRVGLSVALLQGVNFFSRTYYRQGVAVWRRIPYRVGFAVGLHFDAGVGPARPRRSARRSRAMP